MLGILDLGIGNLQSVANAIAEVGEDCLYIENDEDWRAVTHLLIPGVGSFRAAMKAIGERDLHGRIAQFVDSGRPLLGVCLGMQVLVNEGLEGGSSKGLGLIPGTVKKLEERNGFPVPHIGWNNLTKIRDHPVFANLKQDRDFYFNHSYSVYCEDRRNVLGQTDYGAPIEAVIARANVIGFQFHPEKSQINGLRLLENFCSWDGRC